LFFLEGCGSKVMARSCSRALAALAGLLIEVFLGAEGFLALGAFDALGGAVGQDREAWVLSWKKASRMRMSGV
jgi:hypothetical protein